MITTTTASMINKCYTYININILICVSKEFNFNWYLSFKIHAWNNVWQPCEVFIFIVTYVPLITFHFWMNHVYVDATFNNFSVIMQQEQPVSAKNILTNQPEQHFYQTGAQRQWLLPQTEQLEKITYMQKVTDKLIKLYQVHLTTGQESHSKFQW